MDLESPKQFQHILFYDWKYGRRGDVRIFPKRLTELISYLITTGFLGNRLASPRSAKFLNIQHCENGNLRKNLIMKELNCNKTKMEKYEIMKMHNCERYILFLENTKLQK